jgi:hypothetical protein
MLTVTEDRSILTEQGKVLFYGADHFLRDIVDGNHCFICGAKPGFVPFNDEHVIPDWILRKFGLYDKRITLPGGSELVYAQYKVPCCTTCNSRLGEVFEKPISELISRGYSAIVQQVHDEGPLLLFAWFNLIFLKTHLKDRTLLINRDRRFQSGTISELYDWPEMHHVHCVSRTFHTGSAFSLSALGSVFILPAQTDLPLGDFDYGDYFPGRALFLRLGKVVFICVLNDACAVLNLLQEITQKITGPLSALQCRELLAHASYANMLLKNRPRFHTHLDRDSETLTISADVPERIERGEFSALNFGEILYSVLAPSFSAIPFPEPEKARDHIRQGKWGFLFDAEGRFVTNSL